MNKRGISPEFIEELDKSGLLDLYKRHEDELFLAIRNNYINLYYNCASVCKVEYHPRTKQKLYCWVHKKYLGEEVTKKKEENKTIKYYQNKEPQYIIKNYEKIKENIEHVYSKYKHKEKYIQQKLVKNTNLNKDAKWYCLDIEYIKQRNSNKEIQYGRWDIIAISKNKDEDGKHQVALIELKCSEDAIKGNSGIIKHAEQYIEFIDEGKNKYKTYKEHLKPELLRIIENFRDLKIYDLHISDESEIADKPEFFFITLDNKRDSLLKDIRKCLFESKNGKETIRKIKEIDITKENKKGFTPTFLFSDHCYDTTINDILDKNQYSKDNIGLEIRKENLPRKNCTTIIIHRGTHQIGGCVTEIRSKTGTRIAIDIGDNLPTLEPEKQKKLSIPGLTKYTPNPNNDKKFDAVIVTHYHGDHIGLYDSVLKGIPIYTGKHTKEIYKILQKRVLKGKVYNKEIKQSDADIKLQKIDNFKTFNGDEPLQIGDIKITPIKSDHSAFDAYMLLIECDGKRILHTGDFRLHGIMGKDLFNTLEKKVGKVDYLICEGTTLSRNILKNEIKIESEDDIGKKAEDIFKENKYNYVYCSSTNIDRIVQIHKAAIKNSRVFVCDDYQNDILQYINLVAKRENLSDVYKVEQDTVCFYKIKIKHDLEEKMKKNGFVMLVKPNKSTKLIMEKIKNSWGRDSTFIYSTWDGYLNEKYYDLYSNIQDFVPKEPKPIHLHTSGHADEEAIKKVVSTLKPDDIFPIHGEAPEEFYNMGLKNSKIIVLHDGEEFYL